MKEKMKELVTELFEGIVLFALMASFVLGFIFIACVMFWLKVARVWISMH